MNNSVVKTWFSFLQFQFVYCRHRNRQADVPQLLATKSDGLNQWNGWLNFRVP